MPCGTGVPDWIGGGIGVGLAVGVCVVTCVRGDACGRDARRVVVRRRVGVDLFLVVVFGFGFAAGAFFISCPSCCGNAEAFIVNTSVNAKTVRPR